MADILSAKETHSGDGTELNIHRQPKKSHLVEAIVILPRDMLYSTDISVKLRISAGNQQNGKTVKQRNRKNIAELFGRDSKTIRKHIANAINPNRSLGYVYFRGLICNLLIFNTL